MLHESHLASKLSLEMGVPRWLKWLRIHLTMQQMQAGDPGSNPGLRISPREGNGHSNILAWETLWTEKPGGLQFMGSQRVGHD